MCDEEKNRIVATQRAPAGLVADLLMTAETELAVSIGYAVGVISRCEAQDLYTSLVHPKVSC